MKIPKTLDYWDTLRDNIPSTTVPIGFESSPSEESPGFFFWAAMFYLCVIGFDEALRALRVALLYESQGKCLQTIEADTWIEAREQLETRGLVHVSGHGWFA
ncbi:hypothetical protein [Alcaligenes aquatilis]|uniref:hypothetical protein n=1 Tax=Alcaligenes aquatilis TaxID=323284 RepID=UPI003F9350AD